MYPHTLPTTMFLLKLAAFLGIVMPVSIAIGILVFSTDCM